MDPRPYTIKLTRWVDGDTFDADVLIEARLVDVGFHVAVLSQGAQFKIRFRLFDYEAPEDGGVERPMGLIATQAAKMFAPEGDYFQILSYKVPEKYGRWLASIPMHDGIDLAARLIQVGYGKPWDGRSPRPTFDPVTYPSAAQG